MSDEHNADNPYIDIKETSNPKAFQTILFGFPLLCLVLGMPIPFFRFVLTFSTFIYGGIAILAAWMAYKDKENGVERPRPIRKGFDFPKWFKTAFFVAMIIGTAGFRLGWYLAPVMWIITWICANSVIIHLEATFPPKIEEEDEEDNNS
jgi:hypothetical protein